MMQNITLSADEEALAKARNYAKKHNTTLNQIIRDYIQEIVIKSERESFIDEFLKFAQEHAGCSEPGWKFNREELYLRSKWMNE
jgi:hypothetical protein